MSIVKIPLILLALAVIVGCSPKSKTDNLPPAPVPTASSELAAKELPVVPSMTPEERKSFITKATSGLEEQRDKMEGVSFFVNKKRIHLEPRLEAYLSVPDNSRVYLRVNPTYYGDDWVFYDSIKVMADDKVVYERDMQRKDVVRDNSGGSVWEVGDYLGGQPDIQALRTIAASSSATIRFSGSERRHDHNITKQERKNIQEILDVYDALAKKIGA